MYVTALIDSLHCKSKCTSLQESEKFSALKIIKKVHETVDGVIVFVVGLKADVCERQVTVTQAKSSKLLTILFITRKAFGSMWAGELSAKSGKYIQELFLNVAAAIKSCVSDVPDVRDVPEPRIMGKMSPPPRITGHCVVD